MVLFTIKIKRENYKTKTFVKGKVGSIRNSITTAKNTATAIAAQKLVQTFRESEKVTQYTNIVYHDRIALSG